MLRIVSFEVETLTSVSGFPVNFGGWCHSFPDDQTIAPH
jgi:hypothetical protein